MQVGELIKALDEMGDHIPVVVVIRGEETDKMFQIVVVGDTDTIDGVEHFAIEIEPFGS